MVADQYMWTDCSAGDVAVSSRRDSGGGSVSANSISVATDQCFDGGAVDATRTRQATERWRAAAYSSYCPAACQENLVSNSFIRFAFTK